MSCSNYNYGSIIHTSFSFSGSSYVFQTYHFILPLNIDSLVSVVLFHSRNFRQWNVQVSIQCAVGLMRKRIFIELLAYTSIHVLDYFWTDSINLDYFFRLISVLQLPLYKVILWRQTVNQLQNRWIEIMYHKREVKVSSPFRKLISISVSVVLYYTFCGNKGVFILVGK